MKTCVNISVVLFSGIVLLLSCQRNNNADQSGDQKKTTLPDWKKPAKIGFELKNAKEWLQDSTHTDLEKEIVYAVNRTDKANFRKMDTIVVPVDLSGDLVYYLPFPLEVPYLREIDKIVLFSYPTQTFAAYENGILIRTGPTNMGRQKDPTPTGLFFANWKAKKTISTVNDEWELKWNFNIENKQGIGWHQYTMPGFPASHSCLRLTENDAKFLFNWADKWVLEDKSTVLVKGTPVIVFGTYDFKGEKPWRRLVRDPHALDLSKEELETIVSPYKERVLSEQQKRKEYNANR